MLDRLAPIIRERIGDAPYEVRTVSPRDLLHPGRMDVLAPYIYAKHRRLGVDSLYATHLYAAHMLAFNGAREPGSDKAGIAEFLRRFDLLLDDVAANGYRAELGPVPVGRGGVLMDGAHRLAACLAYDVAVPALFCDVPTWEYNAAGLAANAFHGTRLSRPYLEAMVTEYVGLAPDVHIATVFPQAKMDVDSVRLVYGVVYPKSVTLTERGARNLMAVTYPGQDWCDLKARLCFPDGGGDLRVVVLQGTAEDMARLKAEVRERSGVQNHSIHITDTPAEALRLAWALLNDNSVDWLNRGTLLDVPGRYENWCLDGSAVLEAYGLRDARDTDWLSWPDMTGSHNADTARYHAGTVADIVYNPARHFYMGDTKAATPETIRHMKKRRGEAKDITDLELLGPRPDKPTLVNVVYGHLQGAYAEHRGKSTVVWSAAPIEGADLYAYADAFSYRGPTGATNVLLAIEPHTVLPGQYSEDVYARFDHVYTFVPSIAERGGKFHSLDLMAYGQPDATGKLREVPVGYFDRGDRKRGIVMVHGNKQSAQEGEQYTARKDFARWFAEHGQTPMDVYGRPGFPDLPNYRGEAADKHATMAGYTFALALDNTYHPVWSAGYFTREVLDALYCGCIPIVKGCYDIEKHLPDGCYIDLRRFPDLAGLDYALATMSERQIDTYREAARAWLASGEPDRYHAHATYMRLFALCGVEPTGEWAPGLAEGVGPLHLRQDSPEVWTWAALSQVSQPAARPAKRVLRLHKVKEQGGPLAADFMRALREEFGANVFIETGTAHGGTAEAASGVFDRVVTVELSDDLHAAALLKLGGHQNIACLKGDSASALAAMTFADGDVPLVWLDAHWSGDGYAQGAENCPLLRELAAIANWPVKPQVILMDDMRYCSPSDTPTFPRMPTDGFPSLAEIRSAVSAIDPAYDFVLYGDIGLAWLPHDGFDVAQDVRDCGKERLANGLTSILILNYNGKGRIEDCLGSIRQCTRVPFELVVIDNASTDGSKEWLRTQPDVRLIENAENVGVPGGRAQGLPLCTGAYVVALDNDTVVTPGWLETFQRHARNHPDVGMMGPRSNWVSGPQLIQGVPYRDWAQLKDFGANILNSFDGQLTPVPRLVGFCQFLTRACIDKVGNYDASFGLFGFEDDDYTRRAALAGFKPSIAQDVFIHHTGGPQWRGDGEYNALLEQAKQKYIAKWARPDVGVLVFSKDRPAQCDLAVRSFLHQCRDNVPVTVLYATSDADHERRYRELAASLPGVTFRKQADFQADVEDVLGRWEHVALVVDDTIFTHPFSLKEAAAAIKERDALGFSLRLGENVKYGGPPEREPFTFPVYGNYLPASMEKWRWADVPEHRGWGYPLEVSSSVYPVATIRAITAGKSYANPNQLETVLDNGRDAYRDKPMLCFGHSVAFCAVWNTVQAGGAYSQGMSAAEMAAAWDAGKRLDWQAYDGWETDAYHAVPDIRWRA